MLETVIKNTILIALIILIVHFLIKNKLLDESIRLSRAKHTTPSTAHGGMASSPAHHHATSGPVHAGHSAHRSEDADLEAYFNAQMGTAAKPPADQYDIRSGLKHPSVKAVANPSRDDISKYDEDVIRSKNQQISDLYNYVYTDNDNNSLNAYFDESPVAKTQKILDGDALVKCDPYSTDKKLCKNPVEMHIDSKKLKAMEKPSHKYFKNSTTVGEYENDNVMNGAPIVGGLSGFDSYEVQFQTW